MLDRALAFGWLQTAFPISYRKSALRRIWEMVINAL